MQNASRRKFLGLCLGGLGMAGAVAGAYSVLSYLAPLSDEGTGGKISFSVTEIPPNGAKFFDFRGTTGVVIRKQSGELVALSAICTHLGCIVQWEQDKQDFLCPCHGGRYNSDGSVISGPPPRPLEKLAINITNGIVTVG
ncbi:Rieske 2Fe-2S domain-containing protein [Geobacter hydrogenophilus]|uniref:Cytochrome b6 n=1 Tax=Geobacter hydrogenophilus TaxID=40983 RepID=A0A9W6FXB0_9BACT|nr:Rieske 2Fe-2S domain-containing protein [Geobacter hydrogenophilus]MBT0895370.1 Rieske 2Fe-2S domain-containing protein [Geobacter hydrogenophilus]GLI36549.1 cytochrome b6 [Geobacter hydrogenophilus]